MALTYIIINNVQGKCANCFKNKVANINTTYPTEIEDITFDLSEKTISIKCKSERDAENIKKNPQIAEYGTIKIQKNKPIPIKDLNQAYENYKPSLNQNNQWLGFVKPGIALIIGYTELCCVLLSLLPVHGLFLVAGLNLILIGWFGWDHFKAAKGSLIYLMPPILSMLTLISMAFIFPAVMASWYVVWSFGLALSAGAIVSVAWYIRKSLSMETLITLSISMAWLFSTLQLCIPALSIAFGAQLYFQDSMIILGIVGIATQIKQMWSVQKNNWLVYENNRFVKKNTSAILEGHTIVLSPDKAYPFPLEVLNDSVEVNTSIQKDNPNAKNETIDKGSVIMPWQCIETIPKGKTIYATVKDFRKSSALSSPGWADTLAQYFLPGMLTIACLSAVLWYIFAPQAIAVSFAIKAFMGVLMAACPCVLAVVAPICEAIAKEKINKETKTYLKEQVSVSHFTSIQKVVFDKNGTLTKKAPDEHGQWQMRSGCDQNLTHALKRLGKDVFILSGEKDTKSYKNIMARMNLSDNKVICHPVFSSSWQGESTGDDNKTIILSWLAHPSHIQLPKNIIDLVKAYHQDGTNKDDNTRELLVALKALQKDIKKVDKTHVLYVDDGPALATPKTGCLTLQCTDAAQGNALAPTADGQIENPANIPNVFRYMGYTRFYLSQQLVLAMLYNIIAIPLMAGAFCALIMPAPWMGAVLMNVFSMGLIYRSKQLTAYLDKLVLPSYTPSSKGNETQSGSIKGIGEVGSTESTKRKVPQNVNSNKGLQLA